MSISKVCVIGAGVMGSGIAALIASTKTEVLLLDIAIDAKTKDRMLSGKMPQIAHPSLLKFIETGVIDESLEKIKSCDWIIEVIVEKPGIKAELYKKISPYIKSGAIISSNTSTLPMKLLRSFFPVEFQQYFLLTHFFNPPRYMSLLEIIYDEHISPVAQKIISNFLEQKLGKIIVKSNDTPGFIANRIGCFLLELCIKETYEKKIPIPVVDYVFTKYLGFPSTGVFGLIDLIGLDVIQLISNVLISSLDKDDKYHSIYKNYDFYNKMIEEGYKGRKGLGGFYKMNGKVKEVLNLSDMNYETFSKIDLPSDANISEFLSKNKYGKDIKIIIDEFFAYVDSLLGVVSNSKEDIDLAMRLGYSWKYGPFEMRDVLEQGPKPKLEIKSPKKIILENPSCFLYEIEPKKLILSFKTKMNILNHDIFNLIIESIDYAEKNNSEKLIIYNEAKHFSVGADLKLFLQMSENNDMEALDNFISLGQRAFQKIKYSKVPVISCAKGLALGGGCELLLHSHAVVAHLDLAAGLVEVGVGLIPGWGGVKEMVLRANDNKDQLVKNLHNILMQYKTSSAYFFFEDFKIKNGHIVMHEDQMLEYALGFHVEPSMAIHTEARLDGQVAFAPHHDGEPLNIDVIKGLKETITDEHTIFIAKKLQEALNSVTLTEEKLLEVERTLFKQLLVLQETRDKIKLVVSP